MLNIHISYKRSVGRYTYVYETLNRIDEKMSFSNKIA